MKIIIIDSDKRKRYCQTLISEMLIDGSKTVEIKNTDKSPSASQRRTWWMWCGEVADSGVGQDGDKDSVHIRAKWQFVRPILLRDSEIFGIIYRQFRKVIEGSSLKSELCQEFARDYIHTEQLSMAQRAESLKDFERFWLGEGVNLTDPNLMGLDLSKM